MSQPNVHRCSSSTPAGTWAHSAVYSQVFDPLVIMCPNSHGGNSFITLDVTAGMPSTLHTGGKQLSFIAFSQTAEQLVCGGGAPGLETVDILTGCRATFDFPATSTSISTLSSRTVVANARGSGTQLLRLHQGSASHWGQTPIYLPPRYVLGSLWVLNQNTQHGPTRSI